MKPSRFRECPPEQLPPVARFPSEWQTVLERIGERSFRSKQVFRWIHARGVLDPEAMTDLPQSLRLWLSSGQDVSPPAGTVPARGLRPLRSRWSLPPPARVRHTHQAADGTRKLILSLGDDEIVETVLIPARAGDDEPGETDLLEGATEKQGLSVDEGREKVTQCVSTQVGCAMGCVFCASGSGGLRRHLGPDEIAGQVLLGRNLLTEGQSLTNVVLMGTGEPLHNYDAVARAVRLLNHPDGMNLSNRRITVSTVGLVPEIKRLGADFKGNIGLAVSLHAADDATRDRLVPSNRRYPLRAIVDALRAYPLPPRRRITIEYALIEGTNDSCRDARNLAALLRGLRVKINLIPLNTVPDCSLAAPPHQQVLAFQEVLLRGGHTCLIRKRRGDDICAACGQLAGSYANAPRTAATSVSTS